MLMTTHPHPLSITAPLDQDGSGISGGIDPLSERVFYNLWWRQVSQIMKTNSYSASPDN